MAIRLDGGMPVGTTAGTVAAGDDSRFPAVVALPAHLADALTVTDGAMAAGTAVVGSAWKPQSLGGTTQRLPEVGQTIVVTPVANFTYLASALATGTAITALPVTSTSADIPSGSTLLVQCAGNTQTWTTTADAPAGSTSIAVASQAPNFAYPGAATGTNAIHATVSVVQAPIVSTVESVFGTAVTIGASTTAAVSGAVVVYGTDNHAVITAAIEQAQAAGGKLYIPVSSVGGEGFLYNGPLTITGPMDIEGAGVTDLWTTGTTGGGNLSAVTNSQPPWIGGSVLIQAALNTDALALATVGASNNLRHFGIRFAAYHNSTGHGINTTPPAAGSYLDAGQNGSTWDTIKVHGHDGNHYAFYLVNFIYCHFKQLRSYGGGGIYRYNSSNYNYGNSQFDSPRIFMIAGGSADAWHTSGNAGLMNLNTTTAVQIWTACISGLSGGDGTPVPVPPVGGTTGQLAMYHDLVYSSQNSIRDLDIESNVGSYSQFSPKDIGLEGLASVGYGLVAANNVNVNTLSRQQNTTGWDILVTDVVTMTPTSTAAATYDVFVGGSPTAGSGSHVISASVPAAAPAQYGMTYSFTVGAGSYFERDFANSSKTWAWLSKLG